MSHRNLAAELISINNEDAWCASLFKIGRKLGFDYCLIALVPHAGIPLTHAFLRSNYPGNWRDFYDSNELLHIDPTVNHSLQNTTSLFWSPGLFKTRQQQSMYEEASHHGLRSGVTLPIHGPRGSVGLLCLANDAKPSREFNRTVNALLPHLSLLRDVVFQTGIDFAELVCNPHKPIGEFSPIPHLSPREVECLKWIAAGKSSLDTADILNLSTSTVEFHITNARKKLRVNNRSEAVIVAIKWGLINPDGLHPALHGQD